MSHPGGTAVVVTTSPDDVATGLTLPHGQVLLPGTAAFDVQRKKMVWNVDIMGSPRLIAVPKTNEDVSAAVKYAATMPQVLLGVCGGGHSQMACVDDSIMISLSEMNSI